MGCGRWLRNATVLALTGMASPLFAQGGAPAPGAPGSGSQVAAQTGYPVTGRVLCADTQHPARFAQVTLVPASTTVSDYDRGRVAVGRTDLDGHFAMDNVPAGDYYATAEMTGYINDAPGVRIALSQGGDALNAIATVPKVQVTAGGAAVQLSLQRGGIIAGVVQWDDGSPAGGVQVNVSNASGPGAAAPSQFATGSPRAGPFPGFGNGGQTDDRGHFRLSGLPSGSYVLRATVQSPMPRSAGGDGGRSPRLMSLNVYAPNKLRRTDATIVTLAAGEERADASITLGLGGMHTVSGQVSSAAAPVRSGSVLLTDQTDASLNRRGTISPDGSFSVPYVPAGTYTLRITASAQAGNNGRGGGGGDTDSPTRFQPLQASVTVADSDLSGLALTVNAANGSQ